MVSNRTFTAVLGVWASLGVAATAMSHQRTSTVARTTTGIPMNTCRYYAVAPEWWAEEDTYEAVDQVCAMYVEGATNSWDSTPFNLTISVGSAGENIDPFVKHCCRISLGCDEICETGGAPEMTCAQNIHCVDRECVHDPEFDVNAEWCYDAICNCKSTSPPQPSGSPEPKPVSEPISCVVKDEINGICGWNQRATEGDYTCCQWPGLCGNIEPCEASKCCEDKTPANSTASQNSTTTIEMDANSTYIPVNATRCGLTIDLPSFYNYVCHTNAYGMVNYPLLCCTETGNDDCGDLPVCGGERCCMSGPELPENVTTCDPRSATDDQYTCRENFRIRDDGFLCCRHDGEEALELARPECYKFGVFQVCDESTCCVPTGV